MHSIKKLSQLIVQNKDNELLKSFVRTEFNLAKIFGHQKMGNFKPPAEIEIEVPWGKLAGQFWGNKDAPNPVLCIHGWFDNSNSFIPIMPHLQSLSKYAFYCIDLPGHGRSSHFFQGQLYQLADYIFTVKRIKNHYGWKRFSIFGHSLGAIIAFNYAGINNNEIDKIIAVDALTPFVLSKKDMLTILPVIMDDLTTYMDVKYANESLNPPLYTQDEMLKKFLSRDVSGLDVKSVKLIMERGTREVDGKFHFTHDIRMRHLPFMLWLNLKQVQILAENLKADVLYFRATKGVVYQNKKVLKRLQKWTESNPERKNKYSEVILKNADHFCHMNNPEKLAPKIVKFLGN